MQNPIIKRLIPILTETEMVSMYYELGKILNKNKTSEIILEKSEKPQDFTEVKMSLGLECKRKREYLGLTIYAVAKASGLIQNQVKAIEEGQGYNIDALIKLAITIHLNILLKDGEVTE